MDDIQEQTEIANEISTALSQPVGFQDIDEVIVLFAYFAVAKFVVVYRMICWQNLKNWNRKMWRGTCLRLARQQRNYQVFQMSVSVSVGL